MTTSETVNRQHETRGHEETVEQEAELAKKAGEAATAQAVTMENAETEIDRILGDIDDILESDAELFVGSFIQKGGQ